MRHADGPALMIYDFDDCSWSRVVALDYEMTQEQAAMLGITGQVHLVGRRKDVPALLSVFDVFVLPSFTEGLPIALLEAQAHGVPCITSTAVTRESEVITGLVKFVPLSADLDLWARSAITMARAHPNRNSEQRRVAFQSSPYNIDHAVSMLTQIYSHKNADGKRNVKCYFDAPIKSDHAEE